MSMLGKILGSLALVLLIAFAGWHVYNAAQLPGLKAQNAAPVDFAQLPAAPDSAIVAPSTVQIANAKPEPIASPIYAQSAEQVRDTLLKIAAAEPRTELLFRSEDGRRITLLQQSALLRAPDFVAAEFIQRDDGYSEIALFSRSAYGIGAGANARRLERWLRELDFELPPPVRTETPAGAPAAEAPNN